MDRYLGVKILDAEPMNLGRYNILRGWQIPENEDPTREGYRVVYSDGYVSWSPKEIFKEAYRRIDDLTFGLAVEVMKKGHKVARKGWNGKGMWVVMVKARDFEFSELSPHFVIKNVRNSFDTWVPSIVDTLAEDWEVVE